MVTGLTPRQPTKELIGHLWCLRNRRTTSTAWKRPFFPKMPSEYIANRKPKKQREIVKTTAARFKRGGWNFNKGHLLRRWRCRWGEGVCVEGSIRNVQHPSWRWWALFFWLGGGDTGFNRGVSDATLERIGMCEGGLIGVGAARRGSAMIQLCNFYWNKLCIKHCLCLRRN